jgi:hypothetical protein
MRDLSIKCENCIYWLRSMYQFKGEWTEARFGSCRRYPPVTSEPQKVSDFPKTFETSVCGEFKEKG